MSTRHRGDAANIDLHAASRTSKTSAHSHRSHGRHRSPDSPVHNEEARTHDRPSRRHASPYDKEYDVGRDRHRSRSLSPRSTRDGHRRPRSRSPRRTRENRRRPSRSRSPVDARAGRSRRRSRSDSSRQRTRNRSRSASSHSSASDGEDGRKRSAKRHKSGRDRSRSRERDRSKEKERRERKKRKKEKKKKSAAVSGAEWGKYGIINETDMYTKEAEFRAWLVEERMMNPETMSKESTRKEFLRYAEDFNTATLPHEKFYHMEAYERRMNALKAGEYLPPVDTEYDLEADMRAHKSKHKQVKGNTESYLSREQLQDLRRVQQERVEIGKMKLLGMEVKQNMGVRMDGSTFDD